LELSPRQLLVHNPLLPLELSQPLLLAPPLLLEVGVGLLVAEVHLVQSLHLVPHHQPLVPVQLQLQLLVRLLVGSELQVSLLARQVMAFLTASLHTPVIRQTAVASISQQCDVFLKSLDMQRWHVRYAVLQVALDR